MTREELLQRIWIDPQRCFGKTVHSWSAHLGVADSRSSGVGLRSASGSVDREHLDADNVLGPIYKAFGERLWPLMKELNLTLTA